MNLLLNKYPRGVICHSLKESISYALKSLFIELNNKNKIIEFEDRFSSYCDEEYCVSFPFARTAIYFILKSLKLPKGSKILMSPITIKGILDVVDCLGLEPVYIDTEENSYNINSHVLNSMELKEIKACIFTPLYGVVSNVKELEQILRKNQIFSILDFSHQLNSSYEGRKLPFYFNCSVYSSSSIKTLDTLGGGHVVTNDSDLNSSLRECQQKLKKSSRTLLIKKSLINLFRNIATTRIVFNIFTFYVIKIVSSLNPNLTIKQTGNRSKERLKKLPEIWFRRYSSFQSDIGLDQIEQVKKKDAKRIKNANLIKEISGSNNFMSTISNTHNVYWQLTYLSNDAFKLQKFCLEKGIDIATSSLELVSALKDYPGQTTTQNATDIYKRNCIIPCNHKLNSKDAQYIGSIIKEF